MKTMSAREYDRITGQVPMWVTGLFFNGCRVEVQPHGTPHWARVNDIGLTGDSVLVETLDGPARILWSAVGVFRITGVAR